MQKIWNTASELKAIVVRLDPVTRESAKRLAAMLGPVEGDDPLSVKDAALELLDQALADGLLATGRRRTEMVALSDQQYSQSLFVGIAIAQWYASILRGLHLDDELYRILSDSSSFDRNSMLAAKQAAELVRNHQESRDRTPRTAAARGPARVVATRSPESRLPVSDDKKEDMKGFGWFVVFLTMAGLGGLLGCLSALLRG